MTITIGRRELIAALGSRRLGLSLGTRSSRSECDGLPGLGLVPSPYLDALRSGLRERGWIEGCNLTISTYWATGQQEMDAAAHSLAASNPEVIVTQELTIYAVQSVNTAAPVVFGVSGNPVDAKFVESFGRPGGNHTGMSYLTLFTQRSRNNLARHRRRWPVFWKEITNGRAAQLDVHAAHVNNRISVLSQLANYACCNGPPPFTVRRII